MQAARAHSVELLERDGELGRLEALIGAVRSGGSGLVVIEGPAGIGKTALLATAQTIAEPGLRSLSGRASELERDFPFGVVRQWLEPVLAATAETEELLAGAAGLSRPVLASDVPAEALATPTPSVLHGLYWLIANVAARQPLLLWVDDAQWADEASLRLLNYVAGRLDGIAAGLIVACRAPELHEGGALLARLIADPRAEVLRPSALSEQAVTSLVARHTGRQPDEPFAAACQAATGGNPFFVRELARALAHDDVTPAAEHVGRVSTVRPQTLSRALLARLRPRTARLLQALAVLDEPAELALAAELAGVESSDAARAADEATGAGLLADRRPLAFSHPIVRAAVSSSLTAGERARLNAVAAGLLRSRAAPADRIAPHLLATEPRGDPQIVAILQDAATSASGRGAPDVAARALRRALAEPPSDRLRVEVLVQLAGAERQTGSRDDREQAVVHLEEAYRLAAVDPVRRGEILRDLAWLIEPTKEAHSELAPLLDQAIEEVSGIDRELALTLEGARLTGLMFSPGSGAQIGQRLECLGDLDGATPAEGVLLSFVARHRINTGRPAAEIAEAAERAAATPGTLEREGPDSLWLINVSLALAQTDRLDTAERFLSQALELARGQGSASAFALISAHRSRVARRRGKLREAEAEARAALDSGGAEGTYALLPTSVLIDALIEQGRLEEAGDACEQLGFGAQVPDLPPANFVRISRGWLRKERGELEAALDDLEEARRRLERFSTGSPNAVGLDARQRIALIHHALGHTDAAKRQAEDAVEIARALGTPRAIGETLRVAGLVQGGTRGLNSLGEAVAELDRSPARLEHARALIDLGAALRRAGKRAAAREPLRKGFDLADGAGATPLAERARRELAATGTRINRRRRDRLTPSEQRIAEMAARGASNPEIAQALFVTVKTVEGHLSNTYRKLGIRTRHELADALTSGASVERRRDA